MLTDSSLNQIKFWKDNLTEVNGKQYTSDLSCQSIVYLFSSSIVINTVIVTAGNFEP
jgi:hypothetical protein